MLQPTNSQDNAEKSPFARLYQAQHRDYTADLPFWLGLAAQQGSPILELGCGTGRVLITLAEAGYRVYGLDIDPAMLDICSSEIPARLQDRINTFQADMTAFHLETHFPLVILPCNTYSTLDLAERNAVLNCLQQHLLPGGHFAFSIPNPALVAQLTPTDQPEIETHFPHPESGNPVQLSYEITRSPGLLTLVWHYDHLLSDGQVKRFSHRVNHQMTTTHQLLAEIESQGLSLVSTFGDFDGSLHKPDSPDLIVVARQP